MPKWIDILITDRDLDLDAAGIPVQVDNRQSIAQDIKHMILDSGILINLIAERRPQKWATGVLQLEILVETDLRIIPGTVIIYRDKTRDGILWLTAKTVIGGDAIHLQLLPDRITVQ